MLDALQALGNLRVVLAQPLPGPAPVLPTAATAKLASGLTLAAAIKLYEEAEAPNLKSNTWSQRKRALESLKAAIGGATPVSRITREQAGDWAHGLMTQPSSKLKDAPMTKRSAGNAVSHAAQLFAFLAQRGKWVGPNPIKGVVVMTKKEKARRKADVRFADVVGEKINVRSVAESVEGARGSKAFLKKAAGAVPVIGTVVSGTVAAVRMNDAVAEDYAYDQTMRELGGEPRFAYHSSQREAAIIAGEEGGGAAAGATGAYAGTLCGPFAVVCVPAGGIGGGLIGDWAGGKGAGAAFDAASGLTEEEQAQMYRDARKRIQDGNFTVTEDGLR